MTSPPPTSTIRSWRLLTWPNRISILRLILVAPFVLLLLNQESLAWARLAALGIFVVMGVSDFLDGMLARRLGQQTRLGAILDPLVDKVMIVCAVILLRVHLPDAPNARLPLWLVVAVVGKDLWVVAGFVVVLLVTDRFRARPTWPGKVCTFGQVVLVGFTLLAPELNALTAIRSGLGDSVVLALSAIVTGLCVLAVISYTRAGLSFVITEGKSLEAESSDGPL